MQTRLMSWVETVVSTASGFVVSYLITLFLLPAMGFPVSHGQSLGIVSIYTVASLVRSYVVRRMFSR
jgi:hypothetical protein